MSNREYSNVTVKNRKTGKVNPQATRLMNAKNRASATAERNESSGILGKAINRSQLGLSTILGKSEGPRAIRAGIKASKIKKARKKKN